MAKQTLTLGSAATIVVAPDNYGVGIGVGVVAAIGFMVPPRVALANARASL